MDWLGGGTKTTSLSSEHNDTSCNDMLLPDRGWKSCLIELDNFISLFHHRSFFMSLTVNCAYETSCDSPEP